MIANEYNNAIRFVDSFNRRKLRKYEYNTAHAIPTVENAKNAGRNQVGISHVGKCPAVKSYWKPDGHIQYSPCTIVDSQVAAGLKQ